MNPIKEKLSDLVAAMDETPVNKLRVAEKILSIQADLQGVEEIPLDTFEALPPEARLIALQGFLFIIAQTLEEKS